MADPDTGRATDASREFKTEVISSTAGDPGHGVPLNEPSALGLDATMWVALAMLVVIGIAIWKKVPATIAAMLDKRIATIRDQLDAATRLRAEAEALRAEYQGKAATAAADADAMLDSARREADAIRAQAEVDATALIARRQKMAEGKIAAAERAAIGEVRTRAATAAATAAAAIIAERHDAHSDRALVDTTIARLN